MNKPQNLSLDCRNHCNTHDVWLLSRCLDALARCPVTVGIFSLCFLSLPCGVQLAIEVILLLRLYELISMCIISGTIVHHEEEQAYICSVNIRVALDIE
jgi:hypothetical protein